MIRTIFNPNKGYYLPNPSKDSPHEAYTVSTQVTTNGFDQLKWSMSSDTNESDDSSEDDGDNEQVPYEKHSSNMNYVDESGLSTSMLTTLNSNPHHTEDSCDDADNDEGNGKNDQKRQKGKGKANKGSEKKMSKDDRKEARKLKKKQFKESMKADKRNQRNHEIDVYHNSAESEDKIKLLKGLYKQASQFEGDKVLKFYDITVYREDLQNLLDDEWLNDNNLGFIYEYLTRFQIIPTLKQRMKFNSDEKLNNSIVLLMPTFSFLLANHPDPVELKGVLPPIEQASFVFMPVNDNEDLELAEGGSHWSLILCCPRDRKLFIYDSMQFANERESLDLVNKLEKYFGFKYEVFTEKYTPQQINGSDCGISVAANTAILLSRVLNVDDNTLVNLSLKNVSMSAIDARIFVLGTIVNLMKAKGDI